MGRPNPIIERVRVDKLEVCVGEENFAHPDVHTVDGTEADLRISLAGTEFVGSGSTGGKLPFWFLKPMDASKMPVVIVQGAGGTHAEQRLPYIKVNDCRREPPLKLEVNRLPERGPEVFFFRVASAPQGSSAFVWDFGDGVRVTTTEPVTSRDFHERQQTSRFSEFLVTVQTTDTGGKTYSGSKTFELFNRAHGQAARNRTGLPGSPRAGVIQQVPLAVDKPKLQEGPSHE